jgi:hypothetical protein
MRRMTALLDYALEALIIIIIILFILYQPLKPQKTVVMSRDEE